MSTLPEVPAASLADFFKRFEIDASEHPQGIKLTRGADGRSYRCAVTADGWVRGTTIAYACRTFGIDPFELFSGL